MNNYFTIIIAFVIGQFAYTAITVYILQKDKDIDYITAYKAYMKKEIGWFVIAFAGLACVLFAMQDFLDLSIKREDLLNKEVLTLKEKIIFYFRTGSLFVGAFIQHLLFVVFKKGKDEIKKVNDQISNG